MVLCTITFLLYIFVQLHTCNSIPPIKINLLIISRISSVFFSNFFNEDNKIIFKNNVKLAFGFPRIYINFANCCAKMIIFTLLNMHDEATPDSSSTFVQSTPGILNGNVQQSVIMKTRNSYMKIKYDCGQLAVIGTYVPEEGKKDETKKFY